MKIAEKIAWAILFLVSWATTGLIMADSPAFRFNFMKNVSPYLLMTSGGAFFHEPLVETSIHEISESGIVLECQRPCTTMLSTYPATVTANEKWREVFRVEAGKLVFVRRVDPTKVIPAHGTEYEWPDK